MFPQLNGRLIYTVLRTILLTTHFRVPREIFHRIETYGTGFLDSFQARKYRHTALVPTSRNRSYDRGCNFHNVGTVATKNDSKGGRGCP